MCKDYTNGGLRARDPDILFESLRLTWISRLLIPDETTIESWKSIPSYFFEKFGGLNFPLGCKDILSDGNSFFLQKWKEKGVFNSRHLGQ